MHQTLQEYHATSSLSFNFNLQMFTWSKWAWRVMFNNCTFKFCVMSYKLHNSQLLNCKCPSAVTTNSNPQRGMPAIHGIQVNLWHKIDLMCSAASVCVFLDWEGGSTRWYVVYTTWAWKQLDGITVKWLAEAGQAPTGRKKPQILWGNNPGTN